MSRRPEPVYAATIGLGRVLLRALDLTVRTHGLAHLPERGPVVLAANHVSFPDFVFVGAAVRPSGRRVRFMCRHDIWQAHPLLARAMEAMRHVPVDRRAPASAYLTARALLDDDQPVCVFPEAGISAAYAVRALMPGAVALARASGAPLVPVSVWGSQRLWPQKRSADAAFPRPSLARHRLVDVRLHPPMTIAPDADLAETTRALGHRLHDGLETLQRLPEHQPRPGEWAPWHPAHLGGDGLEREESFLLDAMPSWAVPPTWGPGTAQWHAEPREPVGPVS